MNKDNNIVYFLDLLEEYIETDNPAYHDILQTLRTLCTPKSPTSINMISIPSYMSPTSTLNIKNPKLLRMEISSQTQPNLYSTTSTYSTPLKSRMMLEIEFDEYSAN